MEQSQLMWALTVASLAGQQGSYKAKTEEIPHPVPAILKRERVEGCEVTDEILSALTQRGSLASLSGSADGSWSPALLLTWHFPQKCACTEI